MDKLTKSVIKADGFPQVWKNADLGLIEIVYTKRIEIYKIKTRASEKDFDPYHEVNFFLKQNGFKRVGNRDLEIVTLIHEKDSSEGV